MAWVTVELVDETPLTETIDRAGSVRASVSARYLCVSDAAVNQADFLTASAGGVEVPGLLAAYDPTNRPHLRVRKRTVTQETSHKGFVEVEYEDPTDGSSSGDLPSKAARISTRAESYTEGYVVDAEGSPVVNTAGEMFDQAPERQAGIKVYVIRKYVNATTKALLKDAWNTNNSSPFTIDGDEWLEDEGWFADYTFEQVDGSSLWDATITIKCKTGGWVDTPLNVGYREASGRDIKVDTDGTLDFEGGEPVAKPWPLDESGEAKTGAPPTADTLLFYPYERHAWTGVPLS